MTDYIERKAALDLISSQSEIFSEPPMSYEDGIKLEVSHGYYRGIEDIPGADVLEVKHGEWVETDKWRFGAQMDECSVCGVLQILGDINSPNYCPNCGARMKGASNE